MLRINESISVKQYSTHNVLMRSAFEWGCLRKGVMHCNAWKNPLGLTHCTLTRYHMVENTSIQCECVCVSQVCVTAVRDTGWQPRWSWCVAGAAWRRWPWCWESCARAFPCNTTMWMRHTPDWSLRSRSDTHANTCSSTRLVCPIDHRPYPKFCSDTLSGETSYLLIFSKKETAQCASFPAWLGAGWEHCFRIAFLSTYHLIFLF